MITVLHGGKLQTLSVTFTLRTFAQDVRGRPYEMSGDVPARGPAEFFFAFSIDICASHE